MEERVGVREFFVQVGRGLAAWLAALLSTAAAEKPRARPVDIARYGKWPAEGSARLRLDANHVHRFKKEHLGATDIEVEDDFYRQTGRQDAA